MDILMKRLAAPALIALAISPPPATAADPSTASAVSALSGLSLMSPLIILDLACGSYHVSRITTPRHKQANIHARAVNGDGEVVIPVAADLAAHAKIQVGSILEVADIPTGRTVQHRGQVIAYVPTEASQALAHSRRVGDRP